MLLIMAESVQIFFSFVILIIYTGTLINKAHIGLQDLLNRSIKFNIIEEKYFVISLVLKDSTFYLKLFYFVFSILGLFNISFIVFLLADIFFQVRMFEEILLSIWRPIRQIILLILVFFIVIYLFSIIIYYAFWEEYVIKADGADDIDICNSLMTCFSTLFDLFFKVDGG
jgi:hypothetical protein